MTVHTHSMEELVAQIKEKIIGWRRHLHAHPELSFCEYQTSAFIVDVLQKIPGVHIDTSVGTETAVVATLSNGEGRTVALRADMDALPIVEKNECDYRSLNDEVMHACGHDGHTSILLGVVHVLAGCFARGEITGTVKFLFQPAEEATDEKGLTGAPYMIQAGVLDGVDCVMALHLNPENPVGEVLVHDGYSMSNVDVFEAVISGEGGHGAYPHLTKDPIWLLGPVLQSLHGIVARRVSALDPAVVSIGKIEAGSASNIIPTEVRLEGTMRSYRPEVRSLLEKELKRAFSIVEPLGGSFTLKVTHGEPALYNHPEVNNDLRETIQDVFDNMTIIDSPFGLGGEDFSHMTKVVPGAMIFLGCALSDGVKRELHTPIFDIDEECLPIGTMILAETAFRYLSGQYKLPGEGKE
ncbi:M20 metallopeptidase family protein [Robertmurraya sp. GLU-23]